MFQEQQWLNQLEESGQKCAEYSAEWKNKWKHRERVVEWRNRVERWSNSLFRLCDKVEEPIEPESDKKTDSKRVLWQSRPSGRRCSGGGS